jgi:hypothetical protein
LTSQAWAAGQSMILALQELSSTQSTRQSKPAGHVMVVGQGVAAVHSMVQTSLSQLLHIGGHLPPTGGCPSPQHAPDAKHSVSVHSLSGSLPAAMDEQIPSITPFFSARHDSHAPSHGASQQTPSTQFMLLHMGPVVHGPPSTVMHVAEAEHTWSPLHSSS